MTGRSAGSIVVFAKSPRPGLVKTRMTPPLSPEEAAEFYAHLLDDVLTTTADLANRLDLRPVVAVYPADACGEIARRAPSSFRVVAQRGRGLSERMSWAAAEVAAEGSSALLLRSSDSPLIGLEIVQQSLLTLETSDISICPDLDGGYGMIAMRRVAPGLFDHPMSTRNVLEDTLENASRLGLRTQLLPASPDLDTEMDLRELALRRSKGETRECPHTLAFLDERNLWPDRPAPAPSTRSIG